METTTVYVQTFRTKPATAGNVAASASGGAGAAMPALDPARFFSGVGSDMSRHRKTVPTQCGWPSRLSKPVQNAV